MLNSGLEQIAKENSGTENKYQVKLADTLALRAVWKYMQNK
jgi:hypothetical protein